MLLKDAIAIARDKYHRIPPHEIILTPQRRARIKHIGKRKYPVFNKFPGPDDLPS